MLLNVYEHVSIKEKKCTSEQPTEFNLAIPESKITTESGNTAKNSASYVSTVLEYTFFNGLFLILCLY
ncbi:hypothetical protein DPMN_180425 [Dreissena polymorpha]|uniref:Uncharacterized protein n=1 Tax=Dreissena polymorpha TaxID=45954 RepID=A0A9D4EI33_DREPO|nr:hypothetical protein DPMN_180425 [Dreissena polymorpha]